MQEVSEIKLSKRRLSSLVHDSIKSAKAIDLVYVSDSQPGINRVKKGPGFAYIQNGKAVKDKETLDRIKKLVLPPAWENVWICPLPNGHLQATGLDIKGRKQYRYHNLWNTLRNFTKFHHMLDFGKALPDIRRQLQKDVSQADLSQRKVLATIVLLMQYTNIRIGNSAYEKLYGSFGLTTLKNKHVDINGTAVKFSFKGKKGVYHDIAIRSRRLSKIVQQCKELPGKELFQYCDEQGNCHSIDSGMVNSYIKEISGGDFSAKDFRTWSGTLYALEAFKEMGLAETEIETKRNIVAALDIVAKRLGNTRTVCKKYYVHPLVIEHYTNKTITKYLDAAVVQESDMPKDLNPDELMLLKMLERGSAAVIAA